MGTDSEIQSAGVGKSGSSSTAPTAIPGAAGGSAADLKPDAGSSAWRPTLMDHTSDTSGRRVHQRIEEQTRRTPDAVALVFEDQQLTYRELDERADELASRLREHGVVADQPVGICATRSPELVIGMLAILKAGGAYVPMDPLYPKGRIDFMVKDTQMPVLLTEKKLLGLFATRANVILVDEARGEGEREKGRKGERERGIANSDTVSQEKQTDFALRTSHFALRPSHLSPLTSHLAYVIYTSGSTGTPKGVMVTHANVANFLDAMDVLLGRSPGVWLAVTSVSFDISVLELFWTLSRGFKVILQGEGGVAGVRFGAGANGRDGSVRRSIADQIRVHGVTHFQCTPSQAGLLVQDPEALEALRTLKTFLLGGEPLPVALAQRLIGGPELWNMYGPTETTVWSTAYRLGDDGKVCIGRPLLNNEVFIVDEQLRPLPAGEPGEICIGGAGVARGYLNRPELTAERFLPDTFGAQAGGRLYRTGDLARRLPDGNLEFLGRVDQQVKLRGFRVELGEVESVVAQHPSVQQCVASVWEAAANDRRLVVYVVPRPAAAFVPRDLREFVRERLPEYMVPSAFLELPALPLTPNGKVDRKALPPPTALQDSKTTPLAVAQTQLEHTIAAVWQELLQTPSVGLNDNFFDLGGHSVLLAQMQRRLREATGRELPLIELFQAPTVSALARRLGDGAREMSLNGIRDRAARQRAVFGSPPSSDYGEASPPSSGYDRGARTRLRRTTAGQARTRTICA